MKLEYGTQLSREPISLSVGTLKKPLLSEIVKLPGDYSKFSFYEAFLKMTPELFYSKIKGDSGLAYWDSLTEEEKNTISLYQAIIQEKELQDIYVEIFNFFFVEPVVFIDNLFVLLNKEIQNYNDIVPEVDVRGIISEDILLQVLEVLQQVCGIYDEKEPIKEQKFKNKLAKQLYERMQKAEQKKAEAKKSNINYSLPNIVSAVSNRHPSINPINVYDLTVFQLLDAFNRLQLNTVFEIDSTRVSVWGDEKNTFNPALWYKNEYDKE
jgi:hypothetical protein